MRARPAVRASVRTGPFGEPWWAWIALGVGVLVVSAHSASSIVFSVLMKSILAEFDWTRTDFASAMTLRIMVMTAVIPFAGLLTDRIGPRSVLIAGGLIIGSGNLAMSTIGSRAELFSVMAFIGPGQAALSSVAASALVLHAFERRRGLAIGILNGGDNLINSAVPLCAAFSLTRWGWRGTIGSLGFVYFFLAGAILLALKTHRNVSQPAGAAPAGRSEHSSDHGTKRMTLRALPWRDVRLWTLFLAYACIYAFITSVQLHLHAFQTDLGRSAEEASRILSILILVGAIGAPLFGWLAERISPRTALVVVVAGLTGTSTMLWTAQDFATFVAWAFLYGLINGGVVALLALVLNEMFGAHQIGRLMGVSMVFCMTATMLGNVYTAAMFDHLGSYVRVWQSYTGLMLLTLVPVTLLLRQETARV